MQKNKYLLLLSSLGVFVLLVAAAVEENFRKEWRGIQVQGRSDEGAIPVQLRQIVNPTMRIADRCVSCHVTMGPGEQGVTGAKVLTAHRPVVHDPLEYGCTVCHAGQGQATEKADAHGEAEFWPSPMIPARLSYAGCGTCHAPLHIPNQELLHKARGAFERLDCYTCHRVEGRGGTLRPGGSGMEGPDLSRTGLTGYDAGWYPKHQKKAAEGQSGPWKTFADISETDREMAAVFLSTRVAATPLIEAKSAFHSSGCLGCHKVSGVGGDEGPDLSRAGEKDPGQVNVHADPRNPTLSGWIAEHFRSPGSVTAGSQMPAMGMGEDQIAQLTFYILSLRRHELPAAYMPRDRMKAARFAEREFTTDGATLFSAFCSGCHGPEGEGRRSPGMPSFPAIANPAFQELASDTFLEETVKKGRPGRRMPAWGEKEGGLRPEELKSVVAFLRELSGVEQSKDDKPRHWVNADAAEQGKALFAASCSGCHGDKGEGGEGPALHNKGLLAAATDTYLVETIGRGRKGTGMKGFFDPSTVRRTLTRQEIESIVAFLRTWGGKS